MKEKVKQLWLEALRSGKYKQGKGALNIVENGESQYCCLGVLCDVFRKTQKRGRWTEPDTENVRSFVYRDEERVGTVLPLAVMDWAGIDRPNPYLTEGTLASEYNDDKGYTFEQIADIIEENL